jgi:hypothetical protein
MEMELRLVLAFFFILMDSLRKTLFYFSLYWIPNLGFSVAFVNDIRISMLSIFLLIAENDLLGSSAPFFILLCNTNEFRVA